MNLSRTNLLSVRQVAWLTGGSVASVCRAIRVGTLPVVWRRDRVWIPADAVAHLADSPMGGVRR
jgi:hypothetical protein